MLTMSDPYGGYNPYQPPTHDENPYGAAAGQTGHYQRVGDVLIVSKGATLPLNICIATGQASDGVPVTKKLQWANPLIALTILINLLVYFIVYLIARKTGELTYAFSPEFRKRRMYGILLAVVGPILSIVLMGVGFGNNMEGLGLLGLLGIVGTLIAGALMSQPFRIKKIDDNFIHLKLKPEVFAALGL